MSNLMVCNLAYGGKLEELKERILEDKSLATRTDQVKRLWGLRAGDGVNEAQRGCLARPKGGRLLKGQIPAPASPSFPGVTSGLGIRVAGASPANHKYFGEGER